MDGLSVPHDDQDGSDMDHSAKVLQVQMAAGGGGMIQTVGGQLIQVGNGDAGAVLSAAQEDEESRKRRELLARRPSYRKIFNELSDGTMNTVPKVEDNDSDDSLLSNDDKPLLIGRERESQSAHPLHPAPRTKPDPGSSAVVDLNGDDPSPTQTRFILQYTLRL